MKKEVKNTINVNFYKNILNLLKKSRIKAYRSINSIMVETYFEIGEKIFTEEQKNKKRAKYGEKLIKNLSIKLNNEFGKGFSIANLKNFRQFYLTFKDDSKGYTMCSQLSWSHVRLIMRIDSKYKFIYLKELKNEVLKI